VKEGEERGEGRGEGRGERGEGRGERGEGRGERGEGQNVTYYLFEAPGRLNSGHQAGIHGGWEKL
jgi:hypothetical protein